MRPSLSLSELGLFKVIKGDQLVNEEDELDQKVTCVTKEGIFPIEVENVLSQKATQAHKERKFQ